MQLRPILLALATLVASTAANAAPPRPTFSVEGVAFLEKHCLRCHGDKVKKADLALHAFRDDASLLKGRKVWQGVLQAVQSGEMPPQSRPRPSRAEIDTFLSTAKGVFDHAARDAKPDPGRVTVRRLNRAEYNNTIRDLVGVDFNPAEDFPSDDVGHGFDNIGDVLTLPPVLMERYLAAAETIMQRAIAIDPPKPPRRPVDALFLEPGPIREVAWRPIEQGRGGGALHTLYNLTMDGEYTFRVRAHGESPDAEPPRIALKIDGVELKAFDVKDTVKNRGKSYEVTTPLKRGGRRALVTVVNPKAADGKERKVFVQSFSLVGPADTRPESHRRLLAVTPGRSQAEQTREVLERFATRAYRRPASREEVDRLVALAQKHGGKWEAGIQFAMQAVLVSPKFLFRVEPDDRPADPGPHPLGEYQLASRLSYFLWSSMPDDELFALAAKGQLAANLDAQVRRMLKDPKAVALVENFALQWLQLRRLQGHAADPKLFPTFSDPLRAAMLKETELFFWEVVREDRSVLDLIDGKFTYVNGLLARHYGLEDKLPAESGRGFGRRGGRGGRGGGFVRVDLSGTDRAGVLTHASVLTVTSNPTRTSPVKRGKWVLEQILGTPPPPPPPDAPELDDKNQLTGTLRQQMEQHRKNPACANCHAKMDPLGFAFENYDAVGRFRKEDGKHAIDASGVLPDGKVFNGPRELRVILKDKKDLFARCLAEKMLTYALGRGLEHYDNPSLDEITAGLARNDFRFSALVTGVVKSLPFRMRRGTETP
ncbi:MAG: DUF1592 domain-containing protein [Gemmataceae bacterium]